MKLCVFCEHMEHHYSSGGGGCETCGYGGEGETLMSCRKRHWESDLAYQYDLSDYRAKVVMAETCKDYKQVKVMPSPFAAKEGQ